MNSAWNLQVDRIRRRKWLVLASGLIAAAVTFAVGYTSPITYTGWATLTTGSPNRSPEQDGLLSSGYVDYFNSGGYQNKLKASGQFPADVSLRAKTAAASPVIYVEATSSSAGDASSSAATAAAVFRDEINAKLRAVQDATIAAVRKPFDDVRVANGILSDVSLDQLQDRINGINADTTNKVVTLELESGVTKNSRDLWTRALFALIGGWVFGCIVVLASAMLSRRLRTGGELSAKVGLSPIVEVPAGRSDERRRLRAQRFQHLVNAVSLADLPQQATITVTSTVASGGCLQVARALAQGLAAQGVRTVMINADLHHPDGVGLGDIIDDTSIDLSTVMAPTKLPDLMEIKSGSTVAPFAAITHQRFTSLLARLHDSFACVVVAAPPIVEAAETQILCAAADGTLLVVDASASRVKDAVEAVRLLGTTNSCGCSLHQTTSAANNDALPVGCRRGKLIGTVLIDASKADSDVLEPGISDLARRAESWNAPKNGEVPADPVVVTEGV